MERQQLREIKEMSTFELIKELTTRSHVTLVDVPEHIEYLVHRLEPDPLVSDRYKCKDFKINGFGPAMILLIDGI